MFSLTSVITFKVRHFCSKTITKPTFGLLIDIDGVISRGKNAVPGAQETFHKYIIKNGKFSIPTVFLTNASNGLAQTKAGQLSEWLNFQVTEEQVIVAHSPLKMFQEYFDKNIFFTGQGPVEKIAQDIGFKKIVTVDSLRNIFPQLDVVDHERRKFKKNTTNQDFTKIEALVLNGEPVRWETALQLTLDLLITDGDPSRPFSDPAYPHLPILACNPDLQYMAEAHIPRFGHGAFLLCLESLYKKITGNDLIYSVIVGKPSETTYWYAQQRIMEQANVLNIADNIKSLYAIGDNVNADIVGANLFNEDIQNKSTKDKTKCNICNCFSVLVKTGVYTEDLLNLEVNHIHRNFEHLGKKYLIPNHTVKDVTEAVELIFKLETFKQIVESQP